MNIGINLDPGCVAMMGGALEAPLVAALRSAAAGFFFHPHVGLTSESGEARYWRSYPDLPEGVGVYEAYPEIAGYRPPMTALPNGCPAVQLRSTVEKYFQMHAPSNVATSHTWCMAGNITSVAGTQGLFKTSAGKIYPELVVGGANIGAFFSDVPAHQAVTGAPCVTGVQDICWVYDDAAGILSIYWGGKLCATLASGITARAWTPSQLGNNSVRPNVDLAGVYYVAGAHHDIPEHWHRWAMRVCGSADWVYRSIDAPTQQDSSPAYRCSASQRYVTTTARRLILEYSAAGVQYTVDVLAEADSSLLASGSATVESETAENTLRTALAAGSKTIILQDGKSAASIRPWRTSILGAWSDQPLADASVSAPSTRVIVLGDSISVGLKAQPQSAGWVELLRRSLGSNPNRTSATVRLTTTGRGNLGLNSWTLGEETAADMAAAVAGACDGSSRNVVWICLGIGDVYHLWHRVLYREPYGDLLDAIIAACPVGTEVMCQTPLISDFTIDDGGAGIPSEDVTYGAPYYRAEIEAAATARSLISVDGTTLMTTAGLDGDGIHPSTAGHATLAAAIGALL